MAEGVADELRDRRYLIVDGVDGRAHYVDLGVLTEAEPTLSPGLIVEVRGRNSAARTVDRTIAAVAAEHAGVYSATAHRAVDWTASNEHIATHVRRLEALRRKGLVERTPDGEWTVGRDYLEHAARARAGARLAQETGLDYVEAVKGKDVRGAYRRSVALASGRFAVIEHTREFTLVPWRPALERARGRSISGILGDQGLSFSIGKRRGLGL